MNTNMFVEAFHRKLKTVYFQKKQNRRVDRLVFTLLKIARDLIFEGLRKDEIGKRTHWKCETDTKALPNGYKNERKWNDSNTDL